MPASSHRPSRASLTRLLAAAQRVDHPQHVSRGQLQRYVTQWFPRDLWKTIYASGRVRQVEGSATQAHNPFQRFCKHPPRVSPEWAAALQLVVLARHVKGPMTSNSTGRTDGQQKALAAPTSPTAWTAAHLLQFGVFPPAGWSATLALLQVWRDEQRDDAAMPIELSSSSGGRSPHAAAATPTPPSHLSRRLFPPALSAPAAAQLLHHLSLAPPSSQRWQDALLLYQCCAAEAYAPLPHPHQTATASTRTATASPTAPATSAFLKALRHMTLTTLLQAGEWERGLHVYRHSLYQRDLPGTVTTGYLVHALGMAGRWAAVLQVYELCVKLLHAQRSAGGVAAVPAGVAATPSREWGTTLSMAMAAVQSCPAVPSTVLWAMLQQLRRCGDGRREPSAPLPPLVQLDGNFLSAVQALDNESDRVAVLRFAKEEGLLDTFKLIRGLLFKRRWEEALMLFTEAVTSTAASPAAAASEARKRTALHDVSTVSDSALPRSVVHLSRREIGETRLNFLHSCTVDNTATVVAVLNRYRTVRRERSGELVEGVAGGGALALNDREVECVLSKTLEINRDTLASSRCAADFWQYCLRLLDHNYSTDHTAAAAFHSKPVRNTGHGPPRHHRRPTVAALSFLLRHPRLPWRVALQLVTRYDLLAASPDTEAACWAPQKTPSTRRSSADSGHDSAGAAVTPHGLALSAAVACLTSQGQRAAAEALALRALKAEVEAVGRLRGRDGVSLSAALLQAASPSTLREVLLQRCRDGLYVERRVLFHLLREGVRASEKESSARKGVGIAVQWCEQEQAAAFADHRCGRALTVVHLLMQRSGLAGGSSSAVCELPASLFLFATPASTATSALRTTTEVSLPAPWLLMYPAAVHCEVVRAIRCVTTSAVLDRRGTGVSEEVERRACYAQRWTWTTRYLRALAGCFAVPLSHPREAALAEAREAYYAATFEAVISLLDTTATAGAEEQDEEDAVPWTSAQRVRLLCQLLERAIARYGCVPPTHMLLPNQIDRLLPPLAVRGVADTGCTAADVSRSGYSGDDARERCEVAACLVRLTLDALSPVAVDEGSATAVSRQSHDVDAALLHNALKLCCRAAEYQQVLSRAALAETAGVATTAGRMALCTVGGALVRLQVRRCGLRTVRPGALSLLYHLCAAVQGCAGEPRPSLPQKVALDVTEFLLRQQRIRVAAAPHTTRQRGGDWAPSVASAGGSGDVRQLPAPPPNRPSHEKGVGDEDQALAAAVQPRHCELFFSLFGWEDSLHVWYPAFPHDVLRRLAKDPRAIEACLTLEENSKK